MKSAKALELITTSRQYFSNSRFLSKVNIFRSASMFCDSVVSSLADSDLAVLSSMVFLSSAIKRDNSKLFCVNLCYRLVIPLNHVLLEHRRICNLQIPLKPSGFNSHRLHH